LGLVVAVEDSILGDRVAVFEIKLIGVASEQRCLPPTKLGRVVVSGRQKLPEIGPDLQQKTR
jgi:hypothetical protein